MVTFSFLATTSAVLDSTSLGRKGGYVKYKRKSRIGSNKLLKYLVLLLSFGAVSAVADGMEGVNTAKKNTDGPMSLTDSAKQLDEVSRMQLRGNLNPSEAVTQNKVILDSLYDHLESIKEQVEIGGDGTTIALLLESVIIDAQATAELMSEDDSSYTNKDDKLDALALHDSIKYMTASQVDSMAHAFTSKLKELMKNIDDALNVVKEAELSISNEGGTRYHRRGTAEEEWNERDFEFGSHGKGDRNDYWKAFKANSGINIPRSSKLSKYGKRDYVKLPKLKFVDELKQKNGDQSQSRRLQENQEKCRPECDIEDLDCNCRRLFECTQALSSYDFVMLFVGGYVSTHIL